MPHVEASIAFNGSMQSATSMRGWDLRAERVRRGLRQQDVANRLGVSVRRVSNVEAMLRTPPSFTARYLSVLEAE